MSSWSVPDPGTPPVAPAEPIRPSWVWYLVAGIVAVVAVVGAIGVAVVGVARFVDRIDELQRVVMPGEATLQLDRTGGYTVYYEYESEVDGRTFDTGEDPPTDLRLVLVAPDGQPVPLDTYEGSFTYSDAERSGSAQLTFEADEPGAYVLQGAYPGEPSDGREVVLAVGGSLAGGLVGLAVLAVVVAGIGLVLALVLVIVTAVRRGKAKRAARDATAAPGWPGPGGGMPPSVPLPPPPPPPT